MGWKILGTCIIVHQKNDSIQPDVGEKDGVPYVYMFPKVGKKSWNQLVACFSSKDKPSHVAILSEDTLYLTKCSFPTLPNFLRDVETISHTIMRMLFNHV